MMHQNARPQTDTPIQIGGTTPWAYPAREVAALGGTPLGFRAMPRRNPAFIYKRAQEQATAN